MSQSTPSVGRMVHYLVGHPLTVRAAIVTDIPSDPLAQNRVSLAVFFVDRVIFVPNVPEGEEAGFWKWPTILPNPQPPLSPKAA